MNPKTPILTEVLIKSITLNQSDVTRLLQVWDVSIRVPYFINNKLSHGQFRFIR